LKILSFSNYKEFERKEKELQWEQIKYTHPHLINTHRKIYFWIFI